MAATEFTEARSRKPVKKQRGRAPSAATQRELWARSGGVCQYPGCAHVLYRDQCVFWEAVNFGELAHNVGSSVAGPRGDAARSAALSDDPDNLLMLCRKHHKVADTLPAEYRESTLRIWKERHEAAVLGAAQLTRGEAVFPLIVEATQIGGHAVQIDETEVVRTILGEGKAPAARPYRCILDTQAQPDDLNGYWAAQVHTLRDQLRLCHAEQVRNRTDAPTGVFALAEMPMLMALGHAIGDKKQVRIYQYSRHVNSWAFQTPDGPPAGFKYTVPGTIDQDGVALVISLTAMIEEDRVRAILSDSVPILHFTTDSKGTELVQSEATIASFRRAFRQCLTDIENVATRAAPIHLFPCMPASLAVAAGCCVMPKVSNPIRVYDAKGSGGRFRHCLDLPLALSSQNSPVTAPGR